LKKKKKTSSGKKSAYVRGSKKNLPEWYDESLTSARKNLNDKFNLLNKYPKDPYVRSALFNFRKHFRKLRKNKYREYKQNLLNKLDNIEFENSKVEDFLEKYLESNCVADLLIIDPARA